MSTERPAHEYARAVRVPGMLTTYVAVCRCGKRGPASIDRRGARDYLFEDHIQPENEKADGLLR
jgi:hypothetical protein